MSATTSVYQFGPSCEEDRPQVDFQADCNRAIDWLTIGDVARGMRPIEDYEPFDVTVFDERALEWDMYYAGSLGLLSGGATAVLRPYAECCLEFLPASLNGVPYFLITRKEALDCLNRERSELIFFRDSTRVMHIRKYIFRKKLIDDPLIFCIPESLGRLFCTQSIPKIVADEELTGLHMQCVDGPSCLA